MADIEETTPTLEGKLYLQGTNSPDQDVENDTAKWVRLAQEGMQVDGAASFGGMSGSDTHVAVHGDHTFGLKVKDIGYRRVRPVYENVAGEGVVTVYLAAKDR